MSTPQHGLVAIVPSQDLDAAEAFYGQLGFTCPPDSAYEGYRILRNDQGAQVHLRAAEEGWLEPDRNPFGLYFYTEAVDALAARLGVKAENKPWGTYEFAVSDPDGALVRVGWPTHLRQR